jgi:hypothetical protein
MRAVLTMILCGGLLTACANPQMQQHNARMGDQRYANAHYRCQVEYQKVSAATPGVGVAAHINGSNVYDACMRAEGFNR